MNIIFFIVFMSKSFAFEVNDLINLWADEALVASSVEKISKMSKYDSKYSLYTEFCRREIKEKTFPFFCFKAIKVLDFLDISRKEAKALEDLNNVCLQSQVIKDRSIEEIKGLMSVDCFNYIEEQKKIIRYMNRDDT